MVEKADQLPPASVLLLKLRKCVQQSRLIYKALTSPVSSQTTPESPFDPGWGSGWRCQVFPPSVVLLTIDGGPLFPPLRARSGLVRCIAAAGSFEPGALDILRAGPQMTTLLGLW